MPLRPTAACKSAHGLASCFSSLDVLRYSRPERMCRRPLGAFVGRGVQCLTSGASAVAPFRSPARVGSRANRSHSPQFDFGEILPCDVGARRRLFVREAGAPRRFPRALPTREVRRVRRGSPVRFWAEALNRAKRPRRIRLRARKATLRVVEHDRDVFSEFRPAGTLRGNIFGRESVHEVHYCGRRAK